MTASVFTSTRATVPAAHCGAHTLPKATTRLAHTGEGSATGGLGALDFGVDPDERAAHRHPHASSVATAPGASATGMRASGVTCAIGMTSGGRTGGLAGSCQRRPVAPMASYEGQNRRRHRQSPLAGGPR